MTNSLRMRVTTTVLAVAALAGAGAPVASAADRDPVPDSGTVIMSNEEWEALQVLSGLGLVPQESGVYYLGSYEPLR
ncbi:hypothetical protein OG785_16310 [Streptomyces sp. NBC_00006]|uniref:hypothetical protein n=1 Tax=Streptomyces sp. NBC_00006 TaxID=2975619 RepID=UPI002255CC08|nr:hypothetical protein [Streptomyces sp. NBC_00006]MCX5532127.1 hypothetical protein [Streptomyces sp. NBC_00006]